MSTVLQWFVLYVIAPVTAIILMDQVLLRIFDAPGFKDWILSWIFAIAGEVFSLLFMIIGEVFTTIFGHPLAQRFDFASLIGAGILVYVLYWFYKQVAKK